MTPRTVAEPESSPGRPVGAVVPQGTAEKLTRHGKISESFSFGDGGRLRFVVDLPHPKASGPPRISVRASNEGGLSFTLGKADRWSMVAGDGRTMALHSTLKEDKVIAPLTSEDFELLGEVAEGFSIAKVVFENAAGDRKVEVTEPFDPAVLEETLPIPYDPTDPPISPGAIDYSVLVGDDGLVQRVTEASRTPPAKEARVSFEAATRAIQYWRFRSATQGGTPVPSLARESVSVGPPLLMGAVVDVPAAKVREAVEAQLQASAARVIKLPEPGAYVAAVLLPPEKDWLRAQALVVRVAEIDEGHSRFTVTGSTVYHLDSTGACKCTWWSSDETNLVPKTMGAILAGLTSPPAEPFGLAVRQLGSGETPTGFAERWEGARMKQEVLGRLLRASIPVPGETAKSDTAPAPEEFAKPAPKRTTKADAFAVTGDVVPPALVEKVQPIYPEEARKAKVAGKVILQAVIQEDGRVRETEVLRGIPLLNGPAIRAVCAWRYRPATLNGKPVRVFFTVQVNFALQ